MNKKKNLLKILSKKNIGNNSINVNRAWSAVDRWYREVQANPTRCPISESLIAQKILI